jgi:fatty-acyl-CoA synthase
LFTHPAVEQASVVGVPDSKYGEELCAWIKLKKGQRGISSQGPCAPSGAAAGLSSGDAVAEADTVTDQQIRDFCRAKLAHYKVPRFIKFVESFPQTVTGKIQKFKIREAMCGELGLAEQVTA